MEKLVAEYKAWKLKEKGTDKLTKAEVESLREAASKIAPDQNTPAKSQLDTIKERIALRQAKLNALKENGAQDLAKKELQGMGLPSSLTSNSAGGDHSTSESQLAVPSPEKVANGYTSGKATTNTKPAATWPTKATKVSDTGGALQGKAATQTKGESGKVYESEEACDEEKKLEESTSVTDIYVNNFFAEKLSFDALKESLSRGLLG